LSLLIDFDQLHCMPAIPCSVAGGKPIACLRPTFKDGAMLSDDYRELANRNGVFIKLINRGNNLKLSVQ